MLFSFCFLALYEKADIKAPEDKKKHLIIGVSSDRGLCGAIHSSVAKQMKNEVTALIAAGKMTRPAGPVIQGSRGDLLLRTKWGEGETDTKCEKRHINNLSSIKVSLYSARLKA